MCCLYELFVVLYESIIVVLYELIIVVLYELIIVVCFMKLTHFSKIRHKNLVEIYGVCFERTARRILA
jgi:hypothetical protein